MKRRFLYSESRLSALTGISRTDIIKLRKEMKKGVEWRKSKKGKGGSIELSEGAVEIILKTFGLSDTDTTLARLDFTPVAKSTTDPKQDAPYRQIVLHPDCQEVTGIECYAPTELKLLKVSALPPNKRIVKAVNGTGEVYDVIVPDNRQWAIGNRLRAKESERHIGYLELVGDSPRRRGDRLYEFNFA